MVRQTGRRYPDGLPRPRPRRGNDEAWAFASASTVRPTPYGRRNADPARTHPTNPYRPGMPHRHPPGHVPQEHLDAVRQAALALPPLTDEQVEGLGEVIANAREKRRKQRLREAGDVRDVQP
jgi:hypothetical protein